MKVIKSSKEAIEEAVRIIKQGGVVVYPTESFYGLGADATNEEAIRKVFKIKKRKENNPILLIIGELSMLSDLVKEIPLPAKLLIEKLWPGPLTMLFWAKHNVPSVLHAGTGKIGVRLSANPVARAISKLSEVPITGTSANISGTPPCRTASEVMSQLKGVDLVLDAGKLNSSLPSTVIDVTESPFKLIRKGLISEEKIRECLKGDVYA